MIHPSKDPSSATNIQRIGTHVAAAGATTTTVEEHAAQFWWREPPSGAVATSHAQPPTLASSMPLGPMHGGASLGSQQTANLTQPGSPPCTVFVPASVGGVQLGSPNTSFSSPHRPTATPSNAAAGRVNAVALGGVNAVRGSVVSLSTDKEFSHAMQRMLEDWHNVQVVIHEVVDNFHTLATDIYANYVVQKVFDSVHEGERSGDPSFPSSMTAMLVQSVQGRMRAYSFHEYGCRVIQKALERLPSAEVQRLVHELDSCLVDCVFDQHANHVVQKMVEVLPSNSQLIIDAFLPRLPDLALHIFGCRVLQKIFETCVKEDSINVRPMLCGVLDRLNQFAVHEYGNFVVQHALANAPEDIRAAMVEQLLPQFYAHARSKFASNVAERVCSHTTQEERDGLIAELSRPIGHCGNYLVTLMKDGYGNYVVKRLIGVANQEQRARIWWAIQPSLNSIGRSNSGKHLLNYLKTHELEPYSKYAPPMAAAGHSSDSAGSTSGSGGARPSRHSKNASADSSCQSQMLSLLSPDQLQQPPHNTNNNNSNTNAAYALSSPMHLTGVHSGPLGSPVQLPTYVLSTPGTPATGGGGAPPQPGMTHSGSGIFLPASTGQLPAIMSAGSNLNPPGAGGVGEATKYIIMPQYDGPFRGASSSFYSAPLAPGSATASGSYAGLMLGTASMVNPAPVGSGGSGAMCVIPVMMDGGSNPSAVGVAGSGGGSGGLGAPHPPAMMNGAANPNHLGTGHHLPVSNAGSSSNINSSMSSAPVSYGPMETMTNTSVASFAPAKEMPSTGLKFMPYPNANTTTADFSDPTRPREYSSTANSESCFTMDVSELQPVFQSTAFMEAAPSSSTAGLVHHPFSVARMAPGSSILIAANQSSGPHPGFVPAPRGLMLDANSASPTPCYLQYWTPPAEEKHQFARPPQNQL